MSKTGRKGGRPRMFSEPTEPRTLHLPAAFWELLESTFPDLSKGAALAAALRDESMLEAMRTITEAPSS